MEDGQPVIRALSKVLVTKNKDPGARSPVFTMYSLFFPVPEAIVAADRQAGRCSAEASWNAVLELAASALRPCLQLRTYRGY